MTSGIIETGFLIDSFTQKVKQALASLGLWIENGIVQVRELIADKIFAKKARIEKLEMVDQATGEIYCTWIENGDWQKVKGECDASSEQPAEPPVETPPAENPPETETPPATELPAETPTETPAETPTEAPAVTEPALPDETPATP